MSPYLRPGRVESTVATTENALSSRGILKNWDAAEDPSLDYSHGLTGVDQAGNYLWVDVFGWTLLTLGLILLGLHITNMCWRQMRHMAVMGDPTRQAYFKNNQTRWWPWLQRHVLKAPLIHKRHNRTFQLSSAIENGTLPGRWHTIMIVIYVGFNIAWCALIPNGKEHASKIAALRGRSGTLAALNLIPTILFALRNNPLIPLLQVSYDDFNLFHRWCARVTIGEAIVHTVAWLFNTHNGGGWKAVDAALRDEASYSWGMVSTAVFTFIGIQAWSPIRHAFYETFLNVHRITAYIGFLGLYIHLADHGLPQLPWMHVMVGMYIVELTLRFVRGFYNSMSLRQYGSHIKVEAMPGEAVRVTFDLARSWHPRPGCHVHVYFPTLAFPLIWTSHPFSVAWSPASEPARTSKDLELPTTEKEVTSPHAPQTSKQISLICRARTGLTRKLYEKAATSPNETFSTWGWLEGPYGGHHSLDSYGTVLLFAGGVGITHHVMYIRHLIAGHHAGTTATQKILLVWTVPDSDCLEWVHPWMDEILRMPGRKNVLRVMLFITRPKKHLENRSDTVKMFPGRPNVRSLLADEIRGRCGAMAVTVCGSGSFADDVRAATRPRMGDGSVDFVEEAFTY